VGIFASKGFSVTFPTTCFSEPCLGAFSRCGRKTPAATTTRHNDARTSCLTLTSVLTDWIGERRTDLLLVVSVLPFRRRGLWRSRLEGIVIHSRQAPLVRLIRREAQIARSIGTDNARSIALRPCSEVRVIAGALCWRAIKGFHCKLSSTRISPLPRANGSNAFPMIVPGRWISVPATLIGFDIMATLTCHSSPVSPRSLQGVGLRQPLPLPGPLWRPTLSLLLAALRSHQVEPIRPPLRGYHRDEWKERLR
jgi:hypothetical protein